MALNRPLETPDRSPPDKQRGAAEVQPPPKRRPAQRPVPEIGGPKGPEPTRYGDWEKGGRCIDF